MESGTDTAAAPQRGAIWLALGGALAAVIIVALIALLQASSAQRDRDLRLQERSYETMILAIKLDATIASAEAALGRFVISGDQQLGRIYADDWRRASTVLEQLDQVTRSDDAQNRNVRAIRAAYSVRGAELAAVALRTTYAQNNEALSLFYSARVSTARSAIEERIERLSDRERVRLAARTRAADKSLARSNTLTVVLSALGLVAVAGAGVLGWVIVEAVARRRREEQRTAELEDAVMAATSELRDEMATREATEAQLRQAQKMDAVGQLTGGIAHDFNNMLGVVLGGVELAKRRLADGRSDPARHLDQAMDGATRAAELTKRLLAFARAEPLLPNATDADALIAGMAELLDRTLGERIAVRHLAHAADWRVLVDQHQLENAILNLAVNARDAMPGGGTLSIATARRELAVGEVHGLAPGDYIRVAVSDDGAGIEADILPRIFEPFFTTKPIGRGTGLGLSQIFGFVRQSGGSVTVDSAVGVGTTVSLYLPRAHVIEASAVAATEASTVGTRPLKLLVVEDDRRVMTATLDALAELGHLAIACPDPVAAGALLDEHPDVDLVLTDVVMPGLNGPEMIARLRSLRPALRAVFVTGYVGEAADAAAFGDDLVLRKPFTLTTLAATLSAAVEQARHDSAALATPQAA